MKTISQVASDLYKFFTESDNKKTKAYDTKAEVLRIDGDTVWVKIPGGIDETPVSRTNNANVGDQVMVRVSGGRAWILGNETSPATDDTRANYAVEQSNDAIDAANISRLAADIAQESANNASIAAKTADDMAQSAINDAAITKKYAEDSNAHAQDAELSSNNARVAANAATFRLEEIEQVLDVLSWVSDHGQYQYTNDETIIDGKWYFSVVDGTYVVTTPVSNPKLEQLYELKNVDAAVTQYITSHLYLDNNGLHVKMDNSGSQVLINNSGIEVINGDGVTIATYTGSIVLGPDDKSHIEISPDFGVSFYQSTKIEENGVPTNRVAYIQSDRLFIQSATLTNSLQIGNFRWVVLDHRISLKYNPLD